MKYIQLTQGKIAIVDDEDFEKVNKFKWYFHSTGYAFANVKGKKIRMHRLIMGAREGEFPDHINGNKLDNRKGNLRLANKSLNGLNSKIRMDNVSGYRGISYGNQNKKWRARLRIDKVQILEKFFETKEEAIMTYNKHYMEFMNSKGGTQLDFA